MLWFRSFKVQFLVILELKVGVSFSRSNTWIISYYLYYDPINLLNQSRPASMNKLITTPDKTMPQHTTACVSYIDSLGSRGGTYLQGSASNFRIYVQ
jgi:hypothetical protein